MKPTINHNTRRSKYSLRLSGNHYGASSCGLAGWQALTDHTPRTLLQPCGRANLPFSEAALKEGEKDIL